MEQPEFTHTVFDNSNNERYDFRSFDEARLAANRLLAAGHNVRLTRYRPPRRYIDYLAEQEPPPGWAV